MKITALVENISQCGFKTAHGLSLYIETDHNRRVLFDVGHDDTLFENAKRLNIDLSLVDCVVISHGHKDHGGALTKFLEINNRAKIYIQRRAFLPHYSHRATGISDISLKEELKEHPQVVLVDGSMDIDPHLELFTITDNSKCRSSANDSLYEGEQIDNFRHEQNLLIKGGTEVLIMGCGHNGVVNIMDYVSSRYTPKYCIGGFHLTSPSAKRNEPKELLDKIIDELSIYKEIQFYTCHCTGDEVFRYLSQKMDNIAYLYCGDSIECDKD